MQGHLTALYCMLNFQCLQCFYLQSFSYSFSLLSLFVEKSSGLPEHITQSKASVTPLGEASEMLLPQGYRNSPNI